MPSLATEIGGRRLVRRATVIALAEYPEPERISAEIVGARERLGVTIFAVPRTYIPPDR